jgi:hypothetical protein
MVAGLAFGLIVVAGTALPPDLGTPTVLAQGADETPTGDEQPAADETPTAITTPAAQAPAASPSPTPALPDADAAPAPPGIASGRLADGLKGDAVFRSGFCPTGMASGQNVGEGFRLRVTGPCGQHQDVASIAVPGNDITFANGDLALDFKVAAGAERAIINLYLRNRDGTLLAAALNFETDEASLYRRDGTTNTTLVSLAGLRESATPTDWNRLALRVRGADIWLLINDEPLLYAADVLNQEGGVGIGVARTGNVDDQDEVAVVFRDLTVSDVDPAD